MRPGAWGLDFGDPENVEVAPSRDGTEDHSGLISNFMGGDPPRDIVMPPATEHPMSANMGPMLEEFLTENPGELTACDEDGWTMLHHQALAGSETSVSILLQRGADPAAKTNDGRTAADLARVPGWDEVVGLLEAVR